MKKKHKNLKDLERILARALLLIQELKPRVCDRCQGRFDKPAHRFKLLLIHSGEGANNVDDKVSGGFSTKEGGDGGVKGG